MSVESAADRLAMLDDFGVYATYTPAGGSAFVVTGIFDSAYQGVEGGMVDVASESPRFVCQTSQIPDVAEGDTLQVGGVTYIVRVPMPDGTGMTELILEEQ